MNLSGNIGLVSYKFGVGGSWSSYDSEHGVGIHANV